MARRAKTPRFRQFQRFGNTLDLFKGQADIESVLGPGPYHLEAGCGRGEFVLELARRHPETKFIGADIKSDRMWFGAKAASEAKIDNLAYIRAHIRDFGEVFPPGSIEEIWLTFPDPYPKKGQAKHRLTHPGFLEIYHRLLPRKGRLKLKTDNQGLFEWSLGEFENSEGWRLVAAGRDLHADKPAISDWRILTQYEKKFLEIGKTINYIELQKR